MFISDTVFYAGVNDRKVDLFEGQYPVPNGISYNSYIIKGEKVAVMDSVDKNFGEEWLENIEKVLGDKAPDYLVVLHMEPDHSANIKAFLEKYPDAVVVSSAKAFAMMENYFGKEIAKNRLEVKDGGKLDLGGRSLTFVAAPMAMQTKSCSARTRSVSSAILIRTNPGTTKREDIISESSESTARRLSPF